MVLALELGGKGFDLVEEDLELDSGTVLGKDEFLENVVELSWGFIKASEFMKDVFFFLSVSEEKYCN